MDFEFIVPKDCSLCYGRNYSIKEIGNALSTGKDLILDAQNYGTRMFDTEENREKRLKIKELLCANNYELRLAGYNLTSATVDLYQYYFVKIK